MSKQRIRWCVPQSILDVANDVDWSREPAGKIPGRANQLRSIILSNTDLAFLTNDPPVPANPPKQHVRPDVPQAILDVLNEIDFTRTPPARAQEYADQLRKAVFLPFIGLPKRKS